MFEITSNVPMSLTRILRSPASTPRRTSSRLCTSWLAPRAASANALPVGETLCAPVSQPARGPRNRFTSTFAWRPISSISLNSVLVSSMMPLPCETRCTGTLRCRASSSTAARALGPSVEGISMRYSPPSGNRSREVGATAGSSPGSPCARRASLLACMGLHNR